MFETAAQLRCVELPNLHTTTSHHIDSVMAARTWSVIGSRASQIEIWESTPQPLHIELRLRTFLWTSLIVSAV